MAQSTFLAGKVLKQSLPVIEGRPGPDAPNLKRLMLAQGELAEIYDSVEGIRYMAAVELRAGAVRGNHCHKIKKELLYVIRGELLMLVADIESGERASVPVRAGDLCIIPPGIAHALRTVSPGEAIEFSPVKFDPADVSAFRLIDA
jgi:mannose-6-phosphate isomerase-like protein (cupin superfamily)